MIRLRQAATANKEAIKEKTVAMIEIDRHAVKESLVRKVQMKTDRHAQTTIRTIVRQDLNAAVMTTKKMEVLMLKVPIKTTKVRLF